MINNIIQTVVYNILKSAPFEKEYKRRCNLWRDVVIKKNNNLLDSHDVLFVNEPCDYDMVTDYRKKHELRLLAEKDIFVQCAVFRGFLKYEYSSLRDWNPVWWELTNDPR